MKLDSHPIRKKTVPESSPSFFPRRTILILLACCYALGASLSAWHVVARTQSSTQAIEDILKTYNMKNEGAQALDRFDKDHPITSFFLSSTARDTLKLPSSAKADEALHSDVADLLRSVRHHSLAAAWWSWFLVSLSLFYLITVVAVERHFLVRPVFFALTTISVTFFAIGVIAPAMVVWTAPIIPMESGDLSFVVQHQVRGIAAIIWELLTTGHWIIGSFLLLFSIVTPLTKATLTYVITASRSKELNFKIAQILHSIGKWSMADVFVAAILLALYALKAQQATRSIPCLGLYYFIGYCLFSMTTTQLLTHSSLVAGNDRKIPENGLGLAAICGLCAFLICFIAGSSLYTYEQYTVNTHQKITSSGSPQDLDNADLVLPVHKMHSDK